MKRLAVTVMSVIILIGIGLYVKWSWNYDHNEKHTFEVYNAVKDTSGNFIRDEEPLFTGENIDYYDWNSHRIVFKESFIKESTVAVREYKGDNKDTNNTESDTTSEVILVFDEPKDSKSNATIGGSMVFNTGHQDMFMVFVDDELIYEGFYNQSLLSSFLPTGAVMKDGLGYVWIDFRLMDSEEDHRDDSRIYDALNSLGLIKNNS